MKDRDPLPTEKDLCTDLHVICEVPIHACRLGGPWTPGKEPLLGAKLPTSSASTASDFSWTHQLRPDCPGSPLLWVSPGRSPSPEAVPARLAAAHSYAGGLGAGAALA